MKKEIKYLLLLLAVIGAAVAVYFYRNRNKTEAIKEDKPSRTPIIEVGDLEQEFYDDLEPGQCYYDGEIIDDCY